VEGGFKFRFILPVFMPYLYVQVYYGYAESLLEYNQKETRIRAGFILD
jgi:outer membrane phospholipase A